MASPRPIMPLEYCPLCSKNGAKVRVKAYQLNMEEAVFMCSTEECTWPVGYYQLLFMDRPLGKYWTNEWPYIADKFLVDHLKKQRDSLSELSAYTPPQTPGNSKDAIHDTNTVSHSSLPVTKVNVNLEQQPSTSKSKSFEKPVNCTSISKDFSVGSTSSSVNTTSTRGSNPFEMPIIDFTIDNTFIGGNEPLALPVIDCIGDDTTFTSDSQTFGVSSINCIGDSTSRFENKNASSVLVSSFKTESSPVKTPATTKVNSTTKTVTENTAFVNCLSKQSGSLVDDTSSFEKRSKLSVFRDASGEFKKYRLIGKNKSKTFNYKKEFDIFDDIKRAKSTNEQCKPKVIIKSKVDLDKLKPNELREVLSVNSKPNESTNVSKIESIFLKNVKLDSERESKRKEKKTCHTDVNSKIEMEKKAYSASSSFESLGRECQCKVGGTNCCSVFKNSHNFQYDFETMMKDTPTEFNYDGTWQEVDHNLETLLAMLQNDVPQNNLKNTSNHYGNNASNSNTSLFSKPLIVKETTINASKDVKMDIDSIIEDDTLQCTIDETDDPFFASLFSPSMN